MTQLDSTNDDLEDAKLDGLGPESRRLFSEVLGTFLLVVAAAGGPIVNERYPGSVPLPVQVVAPGLMVMAIILFMGAVSGAHLNPAVTFGFALRGDFAWRRVPLYVVAQLVGASIAVAVLVAILGRVGNFGGTDLAPDLSVGAAIACEALLTFGLVSVILGTASKAQSVGPLSAIAVGGYIILAGLWSATLTDASMNPARSFGPALIGGLWQDYWVYVVGPLIGASLAVGAAYILRGPGGDESVRKKAEGLPWIHQPDEDDESGRSKDQLS